MEVKTMEAVKTEVRDLEMHRDMLLQTIKRQAGTLQKANLEGVQNALEAGSPEVRITLKVDVNDSSKATLSIHDDGVGIETKEEMIAHFETFGTPHDDSENIIWKQFRMGRGQMFSFGKNTWRTATFKMVVDIDNKGLVYELTENLPYVQGCKIDIELYRNPVGYSHNSIEDYTECIQKQVRFMEGKIIFNGKQINTPASKYKWDYQDDDAYYLFNVGDDFKVYNLGAFTMNAPLSTMGMMGIVVSKKRFKVNVARNDVNDDCVVYRRVFDVIVKHRIKKTRKAHRRLNSWERLTTLKDLRNGKQNLEDIQTLALIPTAQGKHVSLNVIRKMKQEWCFAPMGDRYADRLMEREQALCIDENIMESLGYDGIKSRFFTWLTRNENRVVYGNDEWENVSILYADFDEMSKGINDTYETIPAKKYTATERRIINVLQNQNCWNGRQILMGYSDTAAGWTNGSTYICIERNWLRGKSVTWGRDIAKIQLLLCHEMAHDDDSRGTHIHGPEFYENMVIYMEQGYSPISYCANFKDAMVKSKVEEKRTKEESKRRKAKQKVNDRLGIAAQVV
jgi:hypothetical protein